MRREWLWDRDEPTEETAVLQVVEGGYSAYMAGDLWSFVSAGKESFGYRASTGVDKSWVGSWFWEDVQNTKRSEIAKNISHKKVFLNENKRM